ncbi:DJ-1 family glyoxalase III [Bulleidia sp. zg-1006]|uniref:DJ-1 family glyoxalase III n=1 Tax=Bulleidia sp. zg-1006 TaxID=2806552 RepID=UPI00193A6466|nr:DJ-1 family glyoxalase III [Bulleidia sp. zg-1006]QRG86303.1 DJ-1/PfpI family protein [Bulleidia sp. zg-1006]
MKTAIFLANGFETCEALITVDLLRRAGMCIDMVSMNENLKVESSHKVAVQANVLFKETKIEEYDILILPGGKLGTMNLEANEELKKAIQKHFEQGRFICAICAAPSILGHLGLLKGKKYTCYPGFEEERFAGEYQQSLIAQDGNIITGRGMGATIDFALAIIERCVGLDARKQVEKGIQYEHSFLEQ